MWLGAISYSGPNRNNWGKIEEMNQSIMTQANSIKIRAVQPLGHYDYKISTDTLSISLSWVPITPTLMATNSSPVKALIRYCASCFRTDFKLPLISSTSIFFCWVKYRHLANVFVVLSWKFKYLIVFSAELNIYMHLEKCLSCYLGNFGFNALKARRNQSSFVL